MKVFQTINLFLNKSFSAFSPHDREQLLATGMLLSLGGGLSLAALWWLMPVGVDWEATFSQLPLIWRDPYQLNTFTNPPWVLLLLPHTLLPLRFGNAINFLVNILVIVGAVRFAKGNGMALVLTLTSPLFFDLARTNNIDWIPLLGFCLGPLFGLPLLAVKPQALGGAAVVWLIGLVRRKAWKTLLPLLIVIGISFAWGFWPLRVHLLAWSWMWNFAPWPWGIPLGAWLLYRAIKQEDIFLGAAATPFLVPYLAPYSAAGLLGIVAARWPRIAQVIWVALWMYVIISVRRYG